MSDSPLFFISYRSKDREKVEWLVEHLRESRLDIWFDRFEIKIGDNIIERLQEGLSKSTHMLLFIGPTYFSGGFTAGEYQSFFNKNRGKLSGKVFIVLDRISVNKFQKSAPFLGNYRCALWREGREKVVKDILGSLKVQRSSFYAHRYYQDVTAIRRYGYLFDPGVSYNRMANALRPRELLFATYSMHVYECACHITDMERFLIIERDIRHTTVSYYAVDLRKLNRGLFDDRGRGLRDNGF
jgi:hypothetical protein